MIEKGGEGRKGKNHKNNAPPFCTLHQREEKVGATVASPAKRKKKGDQIRGEKGEKRNRRSFVAA